MERPILFNTEMVKAILDGRKTQTRRIMKPQPITKGTTYLGIEDGKAVFDEDYPAKTPCQVGDILWVRETWCELWDLDINDQIIDGTNKYYYAADGYNPTPYNCFPDENGFHGDRDCPKWRPSIHMPREAARIFLNVTDVRVERLQDISAHECVLEGVDTKDILQNTPGSNFAQYAKDQFKIIWNSTIEKQDIDKYGWDANPWVWVIEFERVKIDG